MSRPRLLLDASGLIALARLQIIEDVTELVGSIHVTPEVVAEATVGDRPGAHAVRQAIQQGPVIVLEPIEPRPLPGLGRGETATVRRATELGMMAVIDDLDARRTAARLGVALTGTIALLVRLAEIGGRASVVETLDEVDRIGFRVSPAVRAWALQAGSPDGTRS